MNNTDIVLFRHEEFGEVRTLNIDGIPWFVGKNVADNLGYQNGSRDINRHVDEDDKRKRSVQPYSFKQATQCESIQALGDLGGASHNPKARSIPHSRGSA